MGRHGVAYGEARFPVEGAMVPPRSATFAIRPLFSDIAPCECNSFALDAWLQVQPRRAQDGSKVIASRESPRHGSTAASPTLMRLLRRGLIGLGCASLLLSSVPVPASDSQDTLSSEPAFSVHPVGWVRKAEGRTTIVIDERYQPALLGVEALDAVWVLYWFDRNDNPAARSVLQVHPQGNPESPLRGVFATRSPFRPNLIALSRVKVLAVRGNVIEIEDIDAYADTPVLDLKP